MNAPENVAESGQIVLTEGGSMRPLIRAGTRVTLRPCAPSELKPGDLVAFRRDGKIVIHRLLQTRLNGAGIHLREKGDHNAVSTWVEPGGLVGRAVLLERDGQECRIEDDRGIRARKIITLGSRVEAALFERLVKLKTLIAGEASRPATRFLALLLRLCFLPLKLIAAPLFLMAYRWSTVETDPRIQRFLLQAFRHQHGGGTGNLAPPAREVDGARLQQALEAQGMLAPWAALLERLAREQGLPARIAEEARKRRYRCALVHLSALATLKELHDTLTARGIPYAVLKGPGLSLQLYTEEAVRAYGDVDLVVRRQDREAAITALTGSAFRAAGGRVVQGLVRAGHFHIVLEPAKPGRMKVELHWSLVDRANLYRIRESEIFARLRAVSAGGVSFSALSVEDELIYLCLHLVKHAVLNEFGLSENEPPEWFCRSDTGNRLLWFLDIQRFLERYDDALDWSVVHETARRWNTLPEVCQCMAILDRLLPRSKAAAALEHLIADPAGVTPSSRSLMARLFKTGAGRRMIERSLAVNSAFTLRPVRFLFLGGLLFPPPARLLRYYDQDQSWRLPLLYLIHPLVILWKQISW